MSNPKTIALIGPGAMAEAIIAGLLRKEITTPDHILASGPRQERVEELHERYGICPFTDNRAAAGQADVVILAIKPQRLSRVLPGLDGAIPANCTGALDHCRGNHPDHLRRAEAHRGRALACPTHPPKLAKASPSGRQLPA